MVPFCIIQILNQLSLSELYTESSQPPSSSWGGPIKPRSKNLPPWLFCRRLARCPSGRHHRGASRVVHLPSRSPSLALTSKRQAGCIKLVRPPPVAAHRDSSDPDRSPHPTGRTQRISCGTWRGSSESCCLDELFFFVRYSSSLKL